MYFVSRQSYWPEGTKVVEIAAGGLDYANPDMLVSKYAGEGEEYADPREAAEAAIAVCRAWRTDGTRCAVAVGCTGGDTLPFEPSTFRDVRKWARERFASLPKCDQCGGILPRKKDCYHLIDGDGTFCSERCAEKACEDAMTCPECHKWMGSDADDPCTCY